MANGFLTAYLLKKYRGDAPGSGFDVDVSRSTATVPGLPPPAAPDYTPKLTIDDLTKSAMPPGLEPVAATPEMFEGDPFTRKSTPSVDPMISAPKPADVPEPPQMPVAASTPRGGGVTPPAAPIAPAAPSAPQPNAFHEPVEVPAAPAADPLAGFGPEDRAKVVADQGTSGRELLGEALAGIGDAVAKSSGGSGGHLKNTISTVSERKNAAVENFDKARAQAMQNYDLARKVIENNRADATAADMQNPDSPISKAQQALLDRLEPGKDHSKISALQAEILVKPMLERYKINETAQARKDAAADRIALAEASRDQRVSKQNEDRIQGIRKEITGSKSYQNWLDIKNASDNLQNAAANPGAKRSLGAVYSWVKGLDPGSVVREGEIKLAGEARSVGQKLEGYFRRMATGEVLLPEEVRELAAWAKEKEGLARQTAIASNDPAIQQAKRNQFDLSEINKDLFGADGAPAEGGANEVRRKTADGRVIVYDKITKKPLREEKTQ